MSETTSLPNEQPIDENNTSVTWRDTIFETTIESIIIIDEFGKIVEYNPAAEVLFGFKREDAIGATMADLIVPESLRNAHKAGMARYRKEGVGKILGQRLELPAIRADGKEIPIELTVVRVKCPGPIRFAGYIRDLTEQRKAEEAMRLTKFSVDRASYAVFWVLNDASIAYVNEMACEWLGYTEEELRGMTVLDISAEFPPKHWRQHWRDLAEKGSLDFESSLQRKNGERFPVQISANYVEFQGVEYNCAIAIDISERLESERAVRDSEQKLRATMEAALDAVVMADQHGCVALWNPAAEKLFGYRGDEILGRPIHRMLTPHAFRPAADRGWENFSHTGEGDILGSTRELVALHKDGHEFPIEISIATIRLNEQWWAVGVVRDITERKEFEKQLKDALEEAQVANRAKSEFLALVSHEMRTPLNGILGTISLLGDTELVGEQADFVGQCRFAAQQLADLINDVLDFSQIEAGKLELRESPFRLRDLTGQLASSFARQARAKDIGFRYQLEGEIPATVIGDSVRLRQILENLLGNAVKFTGNGYVGMFAELLEEREDEIVLQFTVVDTGIGIAKEDRERIFNRFEQAEASSTRRFGGLGLGLAISRQLVTMLDGEIQVSDGPSGGSQFQFTAKFRKDKNEGRLPKTGSAAVQLRNYMTVAQRPLEVLVAEDDSLSRTVARRMLESVGCRVVTAVDGADAVEKYQHHAENLDIALLDMMMPNMGGREATAEIRRFDEQHGRQIPIVALTAQAMKGDREKCLEAGMDGFIPKPVDREQLYATILSLIPPVDLGDSAKSPPPAVDPSDESIFDQEALMERCSGDVEFCLEIVNLFLETSVELVDELTALTETQDRGRLIEVSHRFKGSVSNMCAPHAFESARDLEAQARDDSYEWPQLVQQVKLVRTEWERLCEVLRHRFSSAS